MYDCLPNFGNSFMIILLCHINQIHIFYTLFKISLMEMLHHFQATCKLLKFYMYCFLIVITPVERMFPVFTNWANTKVLRFYRTHGVHKQ